MKKLLYLLLLTPIIYLASCSKSGVTPQVDANIEEIIVGKTWKLLDTDYGWFHLNDNNTYLTKDYLCDTLEQFGKWELDDNILIFKYTIGAFEYIERNTIINYNDSIVKVQADTSSSLDINIIFEISKEVIRGCMNSNFLNFNPNAQCPDTCMNAPLYGCMDAGACNYDLLANIDDGYCEYITCAGCMDANALNYDATATIDDGSCCYEGGCMDNSALNYDPNACQDDGSCCFVEGCMDATAVNYNANACKDDGSCIGIGDTYQGGILFYLDGNGGGLICAPSDQSFGAEWGCEGTAITGADGTAIGTGNQNTIDIEAGCTTPGTAADICANLTLGGYSDWFLPSNNEIYQMYLNIGPASVLGNIGVFGTGGWYWTSTEYNAWEAWMFRFDNGVLSSVDSPKTYYLNKVRAIRAF